MQILLSCSKTMAAQPLAAPVEATSPRFKAEAEAAARQLQALDSGRIASLLKVKPPQAARVWSAYQALTAAETPEAPALAAYTGVAFRHLDPATLTAGDWRFARHHLFITSFLYGLLRPTDLIRPYRLEGNVRLPQPDGPTRFDHWKSLLTDYLIETVKADDGVLYNLASAEMKRLFCWKRVEQTLTVVTPDFKVVSGEREQSVTVYAKMCRGLAARHLIRRRATGPEGLADFLPDVYEQPIVMSFR